MKQIGHAHAHLEYYFESLVCEKLIWSSEIDDSAFDFPYDKNFYVDKKNYISQLL